MIRFSVILGISIIQGIMVYLTAYNSGYNKGYDTATILEREACEHQHNNSCTYHK